MPKYTTQDIRNLALVGHGSSGKTTLAEALFAKAGLIGTMGNIDKGSTVCDFDPLEKDQQRSLGASVVGFDHKGKRINVVDTPGGNDFIGHAVSAMPAVEAAVVVVNATAGVEMITRRVMDRAAGFGLARMLVVNRIDGEGVDLPALVSQLQTSFGKECLPINLPTKGGQGVVDCFKNPTGDSDFSSVEEAHSALVDQVVEVDEALMEVYLEQGEVSLEQLMPAFKKALREGHLVPICFTSARTGTGVGGLLEIVTELMLNPTEGNPHALQQGDGDDAEELVPDFEAGKQVLAHVFKVAVDPFVGKLGVFRVLQGSINKDSQLYIGNSRKPFKVGHLFTLQGKEHSETDQAIVGDICAVAKVEDIELDAVLSDAHTDKAFTVKGIQYPKPMFGLAIKAKSRSDEAKLGGALQKVLIEDPCLISERDTGTKELVVRGLGELHLRVMLEKMKSRYNVEVTTTPPKIAYRETIAGKAEGHHRHKKQTGGAGQFGEVYLRVEPLERGGGFEFANKIFGGSIPGQYVPAVEKGVRQVMESGAIAGYSMQDVKVEIYDGKHHAVDSKEIAFVTAGKKAFLDAVSKARPQVLEPIVNLEVVVPENNMGDITGDLSSRRGRITGTDAQSGGVVVISGQVPMAELGSYQSYLKSVTAGQGSYSIELSHYEPVPANIKETIVAEFKGHSDDD